MNLYIATLYTGSSTVHVECYARTQEEAEARVLALRNSHYPSHGIESVIKKG